MANRARKNTYIIDVFIKIYKLILQQAEIRHILKYLKSGEKVYLKYRVIIIVIDYNYR